MVPPRAVAFDMDGVLLDSAAVHQRAFNEALARHGITVEYATVAGMRTHEVIEGAVRGLGLAPEQVDALVTDKQRLAVERLARDMPVFPDAAPLLARLAGRLPLALCTSASRASMSNFISQGGFADSFDVVLCGDDVAQAKPDPEVYRRAAEALELPPGDVLVVEDSASGIAAARAAGCQVVHLDRGRRCAGSCGCAACVPDLSAVGGLLDQAARPQHPADWGTLVIAAAGLGTRMAGTGPKALRDVAGRPMIGWIAAAFAAHCRKAVVVTRPGDEAAVVQAVRDAGIDDVTPVAQVSPRGTADAVRAGLAAVDDDAAVVVWADHLGAVRFPGAWDGPVGPPDGLVLPLVRRPDPYVYFTPDSSGRPLMFHETRHGAPRVAEGLSDCGVFLLRPGPVARALDGLLADDAGADVNFLSLFERMADLGVSVQAHVLADPLLSTGVNTAAELDAAVVALGLGGAA
ncbi:MAG: HAD-IA family hydrolase [Actinomycetota bacterium]|nr:HAD-IA family hydrolase [Actinomycetota bacterium]